MKIKVHSSELNRMMKTISQCIDSRFSNYSNIEIVHENNLLTIYGTNGTFYAAVSTPMLGGDGESFCVDGSMFARVCSMCGGEVEISTDSKVCTIKGAGRTRMPIIDGHVNRQERIDGAASVMAAEDFVKCYNGVAFAVSTDQSRIQLTGVLCEFGEYGVKMVALDGFQMSVETAKCEGAVMKVIIPGAFMKLVMQATIIGEDVTIRTNGNRIEASTDSMVLSCGVLAGEYPDYQRILPKDFKTECLVHMEELRNALKCGGIVASKQNLVKLEVSEDCVKVMSNSEEADYDADVPCETQGDGLKIAFNQKYLMNTVNAIGTEEAILRFNSSMNPCVIQGKDEPGLRLLLPVRVQG